MSESESNAAVSDLARLKQRLERRDTLAADCAELREKIEEMERELNGISFWLEEAEREIQKLNGSGLTGLVLAAFGKRTERIAAKTRELEGLREDHGSYDRLLESARRDLAGLEDQIEQLGDARSEYTRYLEDKREALSGSVGESGEALRKHEAEKSDGESQIKCLVSAIEAGREALDHLHDEVHVMGMMGRVRSAEGHGLLRTVVNAGRKRTVDECSSRARHSLTRFRNRIDAAGFGDSMRPLLADADQLLEGMAGKVRTSKLQVKTVDHGAVSRVDEIIREILGNLEDRLVRQKTLVADIDRRIQSILEQS